VIEIKRIFEEDVETLSQVAVKAYSDHYLDFWYDGGEWYLEKSFSIPNLEKEFLEKDSRFYLAMLNEKAVGFFKTRIDRTTPEFGGRKGFEVERIYLTNEATGKGIGKALMEFANNQAKAEGIDFVWLKAMDKSESAIAFYESLGFEKCGRETLKFPQMREELRGMFVMKKELDHKEELPE